MLATSASCTINVQFTPQFIGLTQQRINVQSNGYNGGQPALILSGTGTEGGGVRRNRHQNPDNRDNRR